MVGSTERPQNSHYRACPYYAVSAQAEASRPVPQVLEPAPKSRPLSNHR